MLSRSTIVIFVATLVSAEIPSYIKICGRRNPNLGECVKDSMEGLRSKLREGIPELHVPSLEPLFLKGFPISDTEQLRAYASNVKFYGFTEFEIQNLKVDPVAKEIYIEAIFKEIILDADYDIAVKILVPIHGKGPIHITNNDILAKVTLKYQLITKKGFEYMFFPSMTTKLIVKDYKADFKPVNGADSDTIKIAINAAIDGGRQEILATITPNLEKVISGEVLQLANNICKHFTYDELFPDRE